MRDDFKTYLFDYQHEGEQWMLEIQATSREDAQPRPWPRRNHHCQFAGQAVDDASTGSAIRPCRVL
jgi:hypothetical protein